MNDSGTKPSAQAAETRARILDAGLNAFWEKGYYSTTTREIASAVGLSSAGMYVYFQSKQHLLAEIVESSHVDLVAVLDDVEAHDGAPARRLAGLVAAFSSFNADHQRTALVAERELGALEPESFERVRGLRDHIVELMRTAVADGIADGSFDVDVDEAHDLVLGLVAISKDLARWYQPDGPLSPEELGALHGKGALRLVRATEAGNPSRKDDHHDD